MNPTTPDSGFTLTGQGEAWLLVAVVLGAIALCYAVRAAYRWARREALRFIAEARRPSTGGRPPAPTERFHP